MAEMMRSTRQMTRMDGGGEADIRHVPGGIDIGPLSHTYLRTLTPN
jgi:hypothetical protein